MTFDLIFWFLLIAGIITILAALVSLIVKSMRIYQRDNCPDCNCLISRVVDFCPDCGKPWPFGGH